MSSTLSVTALFACAAAYLVFAALLVMRGKRAALTVALALGALSIAAWAIMALLGAFRLVAPQYVHIARTFQISAWLGVMLVVLFRGTGQRVWLGLTLAAASILVAQLLFQLRITEGFWLLGVRVDAIFMRIAADILGLIIVENMLRNFGRDEFWSLKFLAIGVSTILGLDLFIAIPEFLTRHRSETLGNARPILLTFLLPLFVMTAVRNPAAQLRIHSSRKLVFHTATLVGAGILLEGVAIAAYYVRIYGGDTGTVLSVVLGFSGLVFLALIAASSTIRAGIRRFISENFFAYKYDYRVEWTNLILSLAAQAEGDVPLRVLRTLAELLESPGGAIWIRRGGSQQFAPLAHWSVREELSPLSVDSPEVASVAADDCVLIDLSESENSSFAKLWRDHVQSAWLIVPMRHRASLVAIALIDKPRLPRALEWEDRALIELAALQLALSLAQDDAARALSEGQQLAEFNKRFAFVMHDIKNTIGQLDLLAHNAQLFGADADFRADMGLTLQNAVDKLQNLLAQLKGRRENDDDVMTSSSKSVDVCDLVRKFAAEKQAQGYKISLVADVPKHPTVWLGNGHGFLNVLEQVFNNAIEATPPNDCVSLKLYCTDKALSVDITDHGSGMSQEFIANELFKPLKTTKKRGFGIGAYQAREVVRTLGGDVSVRSTVGSGTTVSIILPLKERTLEPTK
jgi:putative PEP-CTERM system histidine kinase